MSTETIKELLNAEAKRSLKYEQRNFKNLTRPELTAGLYVGDRISFELWIKNWHDSITFRDISGIISPAFSVDFIVYGFTLKPLGPNDEIKIKTIEGKGVFNPDDVPAMPGCPVYDYLARINCWGEIELPTTNYEFESKLITHLID